jgi:hypothetical protein
MEENDRFADTLFFLAGFRLCRDCEDPNRLVRNTFLLCVPCQTARMRAARERTENIDRRDLPSLDEIMA